MTKRTNTAKAAKRNTTAKAKATAKRSNGKRGAVTVAKVAQQAERWDARKDADARIAKVKANPFRPGTARHAYLELCRKARTVGAYVKAKGDSAYVYWYARNKLLVLQQA